MCVCAFRRMPQEIKIQLNVAHRRAGVKIRAPDLPPSRNDDVYPLVLSGEQTGLVPVVLICFHPRKKKKKKNEDKINYPFLFPRSPTNQCKQKNFFAVTVVIVALHGLRELL